MFGNISPVAPNHTHKRMLSESTSQARLWLNPSLKKQLEDAIPNSVSIPRLQQWPIPCHGPQRRMTTDNVFSVLSSSSWSLQNPCPPSQPMLSTPVPQPGHLVACAIVPHCTAEYPRSRPCPRPPRLALLFEARQGY